MASSHHSRPRVLLWLKNGSLDALPHAGELSVIAGRSYLGLYFQGGIHWVEADPSKPEASQAPGLGDYDYLYHGAVRLPITD